MDQGAFGHGPASLPSGLVDGSSSGKLQTAEPAPADASSPGLKSPEAGPKVLDRIELLARVEGDRRLLKEIVRLFMEERPSLVASMEAALREGDAQTLARGAHTAKGALGNLSAPIAQHTAGELELLARRGELALATDVFLRLRAQVEVVEAELRALTQDDRAA
jgi:HPt (histidine-containing phosphotransfer) domain-containing protein